MTSFVQDFSHLHLPSTQLLVRGKSRLYAYDGPIYNENGNTHSLKESILYQPSDPDIRLSPLYSADGSFLCIVFEKKNLTIYDGYSGNVVTELPIANSLKVAFSPRGSFLVTWNTPAKSADGAAVEGNLKVWNVRQGTLVASYQQKVQKIDGVQWTDDEQFFFRMVSNEVHIHLGTDMSPNGIIDKLLHKGFTQFSVAPTSPIPSITTAICVFNPEQKGNPARASLYYFDSSAFTSDDGATSKTGGSYRSGVSGPVTSRTVFAASEAKFMWNSTGSALLLHTHADVDNSNASYYGATGLFFMRVNQLNGNDLVSVKVEQSKDGPIHAVQWSPSGDRFVVSAGRMPCDSTLYDEDAVQLYQFGTAHRNTIIWSPHSRFIAIAGFGNLAGEVDFWDVRGKKCRKLGSTVAHCSVGFGWSPDSRYFMTASLAPRMNVDNGFKVFKYNGVGPVLDYPLDTTYDVLWRPGPKPYSKAASNTNGTTSSGSTYAFAEYPDRGISPKRTHAGDDAESSNAASTTTAATVTKAVIQKAAPYRPPNARGSAPSFTIDRDTTMAGKVKASTGSSSANASAGASVGKFVPSASKRTIPGMAPAAATTTVAKKPASSNSKSNTSNGVLAGTGHSAVVDAMLAAEQKDKRVKALKKKLKQLEDLKLRQSSNEKLDAAQLAKLDGEKELLAELASLDI